MIKPTEDHIVVRDLPPDEMTPGGIYIPSPEKNKAPGAMRGVVLAVGPGRWYDQGSLQRLPLCCKAEDVVFYDTYSGTPVYFKGHEGENLRVIKERDVLGVETK
jgi:co-chaperonin GroES (HSP10)